MIISHSSSLLLGAAASAACRDGVIDDTRMHAYRMWESMTVDPPLKCDISNPSLSELRGQCSPFMGISSICVE